MNEFSVKLFAQSNVILSKIKLSQLICLLLNRKCWSCGSKWNCSIYAL